MIFLDTNIVFAYYLPEVYSAQAQAVYRANQRLTISNFVELEVFAALSRQVRVQSLEPAVARQIAALFTNHVQSGLYEQIHLHSGHYRLARTYIARFDLPLKAPDALHLAVASIENLTLVTADRQLAGNAGTLGLDVDLIAS